MVRLGILSPRLFNNYIDDHVKGVSCEALANKDELAIKCRNKNELDNMIGILEILVKDYEI